MSGQEKPSIANVIAKLPAGHPARAAFESGADVGAVAKLVREDLIRTIKRIEGVHLQLGMRLPTTKRTGSD